MKGGKATKNYRKRFIFVVGSGCSGNSAITDWLKDNSTDDMAVFSGDFEELREIGAIMDAVRGVGEQSFSIQFFLFLIKHNSRLILRMIFGKIFGLSFSSESFQLRNSITRYLRRVALCKVLGLFKGHENIARYLVKRHLESLSSKNFIVLNNPLFINRESFEFANWVGIEYQVIFTFRDFRKQFNEWKFLNYDQVNETKLRIFNKINNPLQRFTAFQKYFFDERKAISEIAKVTYVSYDQFVLEKQYRSMIWKSVFLIKLSAEKHHSFNPTDSRANVYDKNAVPLSGDLDLLMSHYRQLM